MRAVISCRDPALNLGHVLLLMLSGGRPPGASFASATALAERGDSATKPSTAEP